MRNENGVLPITAVEIMRILMSKSLEKESKIEGLKTRELFQPLQIVLFVVQGKKLPRISFVYFSEDAMMQAVLSFNLLGSGVRRSIDQFSTVNIGCLFSF